MDTSDIEKVRAYVAGYLDQALCIKGSPWFEHHIRQTVDLYEKAKMSERSLTMEKFLSELAKPTPPLKSKRR